VRELWDVSSSFSLPHTPIFRGKNNNKKISTDAHSLVAYVVVLFSLHGSFILKVLRFWMRVEERWAFVVYYVCDIPEGWLNRRMMTALELFS
jgi:hypothetical protein